MIEFIGSRSFELNENSAGKEGGRIVRKLITDFIESLIQNAADNQPEEYKQCSAIQLGLDLSSNGSGEAELVEPEIRVEFC